MEEKLEQRPRIQILSDMIFGLALSIGALTLIGQQPKTFPQLIASLAFYAFSFWILIRVWRMYTSIMSILPFETSRLINLNTLLLFFVSIEPYLFNELFTTQGVILYNVFIIYALDLAALFLIMAFFHHYLADEEKKLVPKNLIRKYKFDRNFNLVVAAIFLISTVPFFGTTISLPIIEKQYNIPLRVIIWIFALILALSRNKMEKVLES